MTALVSPALLALRQRTAAAHLELERTLVLMNPAAGRSDYARHVAAMWGWLQPLEPALWNAAWPGTLAVAERAVKTRWLEEDMAAAQADGCLPPERARCDRLALPETQASRYGWAYVIEGSMLGGQVLRARLAERLSPWPARYLQGYGEAGARRWREFLAALADDIRTHEQINEAASAAADAFASVTAWLRQRGAA